MFNQLANLATSVEGIKLLVNISLIIGLITVALVSIFSKTKLKFKHTLNAVLISFCVASYGFTFFCISTIQ